MTRTPFLLLLTLLLSLLARSAPADSRDDTKALIHKTATEQTLTLPLISTSAALVKIEITPADSVLREQDLRKLPGGGQLWIGIWSEGNRGRHLRAWIYSERAKKWSESPIADVMSDLKVGYTIEGEVLVIQTYTLQDDQRLSPAAQQLRFAIPARL